MQKNMQKKSKKKAAGQKDRIAKSNKNAKGSQKNSKKNAEQQFKKRKKNAKKCKKNAHAPKSHKKGDFYKESSRIRQAKARGEPQANRKLLVGP